MVHPVILSGIRSPIGTFLGELAKTSATEIAAIAVREAVHRSTLTLDLIDEVIMGNLLSARLGQAPTRQAAIEDGIPPGCLSKGSHE